MLCAIYCNTLILPVRNLKAKGESLLNLRTIKNTPTPQNLLFLTSILLLTSVLTGNKFFTIINLQSAFFSILVDEAKQYLFAFIWEETQFTWTLMLQVFFFFFESPYFLQIRKAGMDDIKFPRGSTLLQYVDDFTASTCF